MFKRTKYTKEEFVKAVEENYSVASVLKSLGLKATGGNYKLFHHRCQESNLDTSHFTGQGHLKGKTHDWTKKIALEEILIESSKYTSTYHLKSRLLKAELLEYECSSCSISEWQSKPLTLHLDHINGVNNDNRLENLRLLCPNCHSQTSTYCGKNKNKCDKIK